MRKVKPSILMLLLIVCACTQASAQFAAQQSLAAFQLWQINPAFVGNYNALQAQLQYRKMWLGVDGAPTTSQANIALPIMRNTLYGSLAITTDRIGLMRSNTIMAGGTYKLKVNESQHIRFGLQIGATQLAYQGSDVLLTDASDPSANLQNTSSLTLQMGTGILYHSKTWYASLSVPRMLTPEYAGGGKWRTSHSLSDYNYHIQLGKRWAMSPSWKIHAGLYTKKIQALEHQTEAYALAETTALSAGIGYRHKDAILALLQWKVNDQFAIYYAYDHPVSKLRTSRQASHEWMLSYVLSYNNRTTSPRTL